MPSKKKEEVEETIESVNETQSAEEADAESNADAIETIASSEENGTEEPSILSSVIDTVSSAVETVAGTVADGVSAVINAVTGSSSESEKKEIHSKRAEKIGVVASDKMTNTVTVRVDRVVKHPMYRKYIKRRKKFMAHDEMGAAIGDKVKIVETRPLSARKRWRVVEIIQKAER